MANALLSTYQPLPIVFTKGHGAWLTSSDGNVYLDGIAGLGVNLLGHDHPNFTSAIEKSLKAPIHVSNLYEVPERQELASTLCEFTGLDKVFFANSGGEANECALKLSRLYGHQKGISDPCVVVFEGAFHGRTLATLTASGSRKVQGGFEPLMPGFVRAPFGDIEALREIAKVRHNIVAVMIEPLLGSGGIVSAPFEFYQQLNALCHSQDWLIIADEVQSGLGRTGQFLFSQVCGLQPDIVTLGKGLANGFQLSACLTNQKADLFTPGQHGTTFGATPFVCKASLAMLEALKSEKLIDNAKHRGEQLRSLLSDALADIKAEVRGYGLMIGIELPTPSQEITKLASQQQLLVNVTNQKVVRLLPPLIINEIETKQLAEKLSAVIKTFVKIQQNTLQKAIS